MRKFKFTINGSKYNVSIKDLEGNIANIEVNGTPYEVEIDQEVKVQKTPRLVRKSVVNTINDSAILKKNTTVSGYKVEAPLPGNIFKLKVKEGDNVKKGDVLIILEAMKMENNILSEKDGVVSKIHVNEGDAVLQNDVILEIQ
ncbi:biotin/lipoyl-binding protein [Halosquirtibacter xylanolyticus]|uniref:biotin/lipoyl-containing protein n=1 Tax=Halosquirtibacter xylanolyticus TaxID=3374599 RepID=UPI003747B71B|nr:biotin/lipoyl-binding protein [Prolixibacteraceae bacterium]